MSRALAAAAALLVATAAAAQPGSPVTIGTAGPDLDACPSLGTVTGLDPNGDNFLAVRAGPGTEFAKIDEVYTDGSLWLCEKRGRWWGVVYAAGGAFADCGVGTTVDGPQPYSGPCRSGWVFERYVEITAG